jgi:hypothetical protein
LVVWRPRWRGSTNELPGIAASRSHSLPFDNYTLKRLVL